LNLQQDSEEPYDACPYCLTEIVQEEEPKSASYEPETFEPEETEELEEAETEVEETPQMEETVETPKAETPSECLHHLGYLSERSSKEQIPDECMMCKDIVSCMLKKMKE
jgi:hypothetical protein